MVGKVALHPIAEEDCRHFESCHPVAQVDQTQRFDPADIVVLANALFQRLLHPAPGFIRHFFVSSPSVLCSGSPRWRLQPFRRRNRPSGFCPPGPARWRRKAGNRTAPAGDSGQHANALCRQSRQRHWQNCMAVTAQTGQHIDHKQRFQRPVSGAWQQDLWISVRDCVLSPRRCESLGQSYQGRARLCNRTCCLTQICRSESPGQCKTATTGKIRAP